MPGTKKVGADAELKAASYLAKQGLKLVRSNYLCRSGEIDLIMQHGDALVFVEVRYRKSIRFGGALASIGQKKQRRITLAALRYLQQHPWNGPCRFDVLALQGNEACEWIRDAFPAAG